MARPLLLLLPILLVLLLAAQLPHLAEGRSTTSSGGLTVIDSERLRIRTTSSTASAQHPNQGTIPASAASPRKRHRKRNSNWIDYRNFDENTTALEWANPCGGNYHPSAGDRFNRQRPRQVSSNGSALWTRSICNPLPILSASPQSFNQLKRHAFREYRSLNSSQDSAIDIRNMTMWSLHTHNYKFLPKLKPNSTVSNPTVILFIY